MTVEAPVTIVSGFGRCGTSMVMQMLNRVGMKTSGVWPSFEHDAALVSSFDAAWISRQAGSAVKVIDLQLDKIYRPLRRTGAGFRVVWCDRDPAQQAKSHVKFIRAMHAFHLNRAARKRLERSFRNDIKLAIQRAAALGPVHQVSFGGALHAPRECAHDLLHFCGIALDRVPLAAAAIRPRSPLCAPGLDLEVSLIAERAAP